MRKYYGKEKCKILKQIRAEIARQNDIEWVVSECKHKGNCRGTCPKCEYEVRQLEAALARREALGKKVAVVGISAGLALSVTGCDTLLQSTAGEPMFDGVEVLESVEETEDRTLPGGTTLPDETEPVVMGDMLMGEPLPPDTEPPVPGEEVVEGEMPLPPELCETEMGEMLPEVESESESESESDTDEETFEDVLMGDPVM